VTDEYKKAAAVLCRQRISAGGFRLSHLVQDIYTAHEKMSKVQKATKFLN